MIYHGTLPAITIVLSVMGGWLLGMRNMMVSTLAEDYVTTAEAKG
ncbi:ABC transporter permease subunit, partial [Pseudomonadaceae bacterium Sa2CUA2]|nr:ABC transporter permease subunit [Serpens gallinarum]